MSANDFDEEKVKSIKMCAEAGVKTDLKITMEKATDTSNAKVLRAAFLKSKVWPSNTTIKIGFLGNAGENVKRTSLSIMQKAVDVNGISLPIDPLQNTEIDKLPIRDAVIKVVTERLQPIVNLKLQFYDNDNKLLNPFICDIRITFDPNSGAWSMVGTDCLNNKNKNTATMNLGWFDVPTTLHEFCHALGMIHEHQNPKGNEILWNKQRVLKWARTTQGWDAKTTNSNIIERYSMDEINGSSFDPRSIMLYFFPGDLVLDEKTKDCCGKGTQQNYQFSPYDVLYLNNTYPLQNTSLTPEQFTVKFFNDVFNQKVDASDLSQQLEATEEKEGKEESQLLQTTKMNSVKPEETTKNQVGKTEGKICFSYGHLMSYIFLFVLFLFLVFLLVWILVSIKKT
jgi:hypothetical protein